MTCSGNATEYCGGSDRLNVYYNPAIAIVKPVTVASAGGFVSQGCWTDNVASRTLSDKSVPGNTMTVEQCATICEGYTYFGVEYSRECYCGNTIKAGAALATSGCDMTCAGNATEYCGGKARMSMYKAGTAAKRSRLEGARLLN